MNEYTCTYNHTYSIGYIEQGWIQGGIGGMRPPPPARIYPYSLVVSIFSEVLYKVLVKISYSVENIFHTAEEIFLQTTSILERLAFSSCTFIAYLQ